jgi:hypothetical protein
MYSMIGSVEYDMVQPYWRKTQGRERDRRWALVSDHQASAYQPLVAAAGAAAAPPDS